MNNSHASALKFKHTEIERKLATEEARPMPNDLVIHDLKKRKLALKDEIVRVTEGV